MTADSDPNIELECVRQGKSSKFAVILRQPDGDNLVRYVLLADQDARREYADEICDLRPGIERDELLHILEQEAARQLAAEPGGSGGGSQADRIVALVTAIEGLELFHSTDGWAYASLPVGDHTETWKLSSKGFKEWLAHLSYRELDKVPGSQAVQDALGALGGKARFDGEEREVHLRVAAHGDDIWLDLCDAQWRAVRISRDGWELVASKDVPVKFIRRKGMLPLPEPARGGSVEDLRPLLNMPDDETWTLAVGWLIGAFRPTGPYGVLSVSGEQGSAKSTVGKLLRGLIDPNISPLRRLPKSERDIFISAGNGWTSVYNNMSGVRPELSDALCALATDGGFATRQLYADDEEAIFSARRPVVLNGIDDPASRSDLVDRCIALALKRIAEEDYRTEEAIIAEYERVRPGVLGALLDAVAAALKNQSSVTFTKLPRMADLTIWVTAAEEGLGWEPGRFHDAFMGNRAESHVDVVTASPIGPPLLALVEEAPFEGTATELLAQLNTRRGADPAPDGWPKGYSGMASMLRRLAGDLRSVGVEVELPEKGRGHDKKRLIRLEKSGNQRAARTARAADAENDAADAEPLRRVDDDVRRVGDGDPHETRRSDCDGVQPGAAPDTDADRAARAARPVRTQSNRGDDPWRQ